MLLRLILLAFAITCSIPATGQDAEQPPSADRLSNEACLGCHADADLTNEEGNSMTVHADVLAGTAHSTLKCVDCHSDAILVRHPRRKLTPVPIANCALCHSEAVTALRQSVHGRQEGGVTVETCSNCHEAPHDIKKASEPSSAVHISNLTDTCGTCHRPVKREFAKSAHATAQAAGDPKAPTCTSCHGSGHAIPEDQSTVETRQKFTDECGACHGERYHTFNDSFHGKATALGYQASAMCSDCHTAHLALPASSPDSSVHESHLEMTCGQCHKEEMNAGFVTFDPHSDPTDPTRDPIVHYIWLFMTWLLLGVFGFFGIHALLWLQRSIVGAMRGEFPKHVEEGPYVRRFNKTQIWLHVTVIVSFLLLAATGLPLKFATAPWAPPLARLLGGPEMAAWLHRLAAIITFGYFAVHLVNMVFDMFVKKEKGYLWGPRSMVPQPRDIADMFANFRYFLYLGPRPTFDRWTYWEKFDYLAVFWGVAMIGVSGLVLWFPGAVTSVLPGWVLNAAYIIHSDEALLATGFIFIFHFFHTHLRPESFPLDPVVFTGRQSLARLKEERPLEYQRLVESKQLERLYVEPPSRAMLVQAHIFGFIAVAIGILLAIAIFWALLRSL